MPSIQSDARGQAAGDVHRCLISLQIFRRYIVLWDLFRVNFSYVRVGRVFHSADRFGLKGLPLLDQFFDALPACLRDIRQSLSVPRLAG